MSEYPEGWTIGLAYKKLCIGDKAPHHPKAHQLNDPALRFIHRLLSINISGKGKDIGQCSKTELFILQCMAEKRKMHMGYWVASLLRKVMPTQHMSFGSILTRLAKKLTGSQFNAENFTLYSSIKILDLKAFDRWVSFLLLTVM